MVLFRGMSALALFSVPRFALLWYYSGQHHSHTNIESRACHWRYANCWGRLLAGANSKADQLTTTQVCVQYRNIRIPSQSQILFGGVFSQVVVAPFLVAPLERVKVLLQVNTKHCPWNLSKDSKLQIHPGKFSGQVDCFKHIISEEGAKGVFRYTLPYFHW